MASSSKPKTFEHKHYDVTDTCAWVLGCCMLSTTLDLEPEEVVLTRKDCCSSTTSRRPYGELGSVDVARGCGVCYAFNSSFGPIQPGCGCEGELVTEIVEELKARMKMRGDTGQIQRAEEQLDEIKKVQGDVNELNAKMDAIMEHLKISVPQQQMDR